MRNTFRDKRELMVSSVCISMCVNVEKKLELYGLREICRNFLKIVVCRILCVCVCAYIYNLNI